MTKDEVKAIIAEYLAEKLEIKLAVRKEYPWGEPGVTLHVDVSLELEGEVLTDASDTFSLNVNL